MQSWNIIIILGLKEVASYWTPKTVLLCKSLYGEIGPGVGGPTIKDKMNEIHHQQAALTYLHSTKSSLRC
jgi:hypothetical protein